MNRINTTTATIIDLTAEEAETLGVLSDLISNHINLYELTAKELQQLEAGQELIERLWHFGKNR